MKVLVACEFSGTVRQAFYRMGHDAWSCDLQKSEIPGKHYRGDVREIIHLGWDLMIAHPPCTHLAVSGAAWFKNKVKEQEEALNFVRFLMDAPIEMWCIENPVSVISTKIRKPDQIIQPYMFGHMARKTTCLWLKGLPKLTETNNVKEELYKLPKNQQNPLHQLGPSQDRSNLRSKTYPWIARAMAEQWGKHE